jgi:hypothetical protein
MSDDITSTWRLITPTSYRKNEAALKEVDRQKSTSLAITWPTNCATRYADPRKGPHVQRQMAGGWQDRGNVPIDDETPTSATDPLTTRLTKAGANKSSETVDERNSAADISQRRAKTPANLWLIKHGPRWRRHRRAAISDFNSHPHHSGSCPTHRLTPGYNTTA